MVAHYKDGLTTGYGGGTAQAETTRTVAGAQEVVLVHQGGLGEADAGGVIMNVMPRDGGNIYQAPSSPRRHWCPAGKQLHRT